MTLYSVEVWYNSERSTRVDTVAVKKSKRKAEQIIKAIKTKYYGTGSPISMARVQEWDDSKETEDVLKAIALIEENVRQNIRKGYF